MYSSNCLEKQALHKLTSGTTDAASDLNLQFPLSPFKNNVSYFITITCLIKTHSQTKQSHTHYINPSFSKLHTNAGILFPHLASTITCNKEIKSSHTTFLLSTAFVSLFSVSLYFHQTYLDRKFRHACLINGQLSMM